MSGELLIVSTPIGNLGDISSRVKDALTRASIVLAEDTRVTSKLLYHLGLRRTLVSCHDFNELRRVNVLENAVAENLAVALVSDAGTPLVSDPGYQLVKRAIELGMTVTPIPGPSAVLAALVGSGLPCDRFIFEGFLPEKKGDLVRRLESLKQEERTLVLYVAPSNLKAVLSAILEVLGDRQACLARELTKLYEEFIRKTIAELILHIQETPVRGEFVLVVSGALPGEKSIASQEFVENRIRALLSSGGRLKEVSIVLARETGWSSSELYKVGLGIKEGIDSQS